MRTEATRWSDEHPFVAMVIALLVAAAVAALVTAGDAIDGTAGSALRALGIVVALAAIALVFRIPERALGVANAIRRARRRA